MDQIVSDFLVETTFVNLKPNVNKYEVVRKELVYDHTTVSGSASELYIEPMKPCVGDLDLMRADDEVIAVQSADQLQHDIQLPSMYKNTVNVNAIVDTEYPAYVTLMKIGELHKQSDSKKYAFVTKGVADIGSVLQWARPTETTFKGPASQGLSGTTTIDSRVVGREQVDAIHCLSWPEQAADWPTRTRNWPELTTVDLIVNQGCDLISGVEHRQFGESEEQGVQHRLSFSRAETVLLNSWTPVQQIVYHILRTLLGLEGLTEVRDSRGGRILARYHVKTVMLWVCERKDHSFWERANVVVLSTEFLRLLMKSCATGCCPGYFVKDHNLFECDIESVELREVTERLSKLSHTRNVTSRLITQYIKLCVQNCIPDTDIQQLFSESIRNLDEMRALTSAVISHRKNTAGYERFERYIWAQATTADAITRVAKKTSKRLVNIEKFLAVDENVFCFALACVFLVLSCNLTETKLSDVVDVIFHLLVRRKNRNVAPSKISFAAQQTDSRISLTSLVPLLQQSALTPCESGTVGLQLIVTHHYLNHIRMVSKCDGERCIAGVYLAVQLYNARQYNTTAELCSRIGQSKCKSSVVEGQLLPKFDCDIDNILGVVTLYQQIRTNALHQRQQKLRSSKPLCNVLNIWLVLHVIRLKWLSSQGVKLRWDHHKVLQNAGIFSITDFLLLYTLHRFDDCVKKLPAIVTDFGVSSLRQELERSAVEHLTLYHQFLSREFSSGCTVVTTDFEALFALRTGSYETCHQLSLQSVSSLWLESETHIVVLSNCITALLDDVLASLSGFWIVTSKLRPENVENIGRFSMRQKTLCLYLLICSRFKLNRVTWPLVNELRSLMQDNDQRPIENAEDRLVLSFVYRHFLIRAKKATCVVTC